VPIDSWGLGFSYIQELQESIDGKLLYGYRWIASFWQKISFATIDPGQIVNSQPSFLIEFREPVSFWAGLIYNLLKIQLPELRGVLQGFA
jgi:hypothetical protein